MKDLGAKLSPELNRLVTLVIDAAMEVHTILGPGHLESVYQQAMEIELRFQGVPFVQLKQFQVRYKGRRVGGGEIDLLVGDLLVVELKCVSNFAEIHMAQVLSYLRAGNYRLGLLLNFQTAHLKDGIKRVAN